MKKRGKKKAKSRNSKPWFMKGSGDWNWVPLNWKGGIALFILFFINIFSAQYFRIINFEIDGFIKFLTVFFISMFIFIMFAKKKTKR